MLSLDDPAWATFDGGYRTPYDVSKPLQQLESGAVQRDAVWEELVEELHHQQDVGIASYAAVPHLVCICRQKNWIDWKVFALVGWIEDARHLEDNPPLPDWLEADYKTAIHDLFLFGAENADGTWDRELSFSFLIIAAFAMNFVTHGRLLNHFSDQAEADEILKNLKR